MGGRILQMCRPSSEGGYYYRYEDIDPDVCLVCMARRKPNVIDMAVLPCEEVLDDNKRVIGRRVPRIGCMMVEREIREVQVGQEGD